MLISHNCIFFLSETYKVCGFSGHGAPVRSHHTQVCWYSTHRFLKSSFLFCVPDTHSTSGYPAFSTGAASVSSFRISFPAFPDIRRQSHPHGLLLHMLQLPLRFFCQVLCSGVSYKLTFPPPVQDRAPAEIFGSAPMYGTSGLFHWGN